MSKRKFTQEEIKEIVTKLEDIYTLRTFEDADPYRVLIRTILSQRTRDENTDNATRRLFNKYSTMKEILDAPIEEIEELVRPAGFYKVKTQRIKEVTKIIIEDYDKQVPDTMEELLELPGVGRKTANCVLVYAFFKDAIPVDVHVHRISNRLGLVSTKTPEETEEELCNIVPQKYWLPINDLMVQFGQTICKPINPEHSVCPLTEICAEYNNFKK
ncbi:MAG: endonuclease III [Methanobacteriaceae archaeon]|nr:endonuclease III [Methanobacteriaceae archaeon]